MYNTAGLTINAGVPTAGFVVATQNGWWLPAAVALLVLGLFGVLIAARAHRMQTRDFACD